MINSKKKAIKLAEEINRLNGSDLINIESFKKSKLEHMRISLGIAIQFLPNENKTEVTK